jgi:hypothetical protein
MKKNGDLFLHMLTFSRCEALSMMMMMIIINVQPIWKTDEMATVLELNNNKHLQSLFLSQLHHEPHFVPVGQMPGPLFHEFRETTP